MAFSAQTVTLHLQQQHWHVLPLGGDTYCPVVSTHVMPHGKPAAVVLTKAAPVYMRVAQEERHGICVRFWEQLLRLSATENVYLFIWEAKNKMVCSASLRILKTPISMGPASGRFCSHGMAFFPRRLFTLQTPAQVLHSVPLAPLQTPPHQGQLL